MQLLRSIAIVFCLLLVALPAQSAPSAFSGLTITRVVLKDDFGNPWSQPDQIAELIGVKAGDMFTGSSVREGLALLYLKGTFRDIIVEGFPENGGVRLEYTFVPVTVVTKVVVNGRHALKKDQIMDALSGLEGKELRQGRLPRYREDILALYQAAGYFDAGVSFRLESGPLPKGETPQGETGAGQPALPVTFNDKLGPHQAVLHVDISEGEPTLIEEITFVGNTVFTEKKLLAAIKSRVGSPLNRDRLLDTDKEAVVEKYADAAYPAAKVGPVSMSFRDHKAYVRIDITEGPRVTVRFTGNKEFGSKKLKTSPSHLAGARRIGRRDRRQRRPDQDVVPGTGIRRRDGRDEENGGAGQA